MSPLNKPILFWLALGAIGIALAPWYLGQPGSALTLALAGRSPWLLPLALPLLLGLVPALRPAMKPAARSAWLVALGTAGLLWLVAQGTAIDHRGWSFAWLAAMTGSPGPTQPGMGYGAFLAALAFLVLLCHGMAARGA